MSSISRLSYNDAVSQGAPQTPEEQAVQKDRFRTLSGRIVDRLRPVPEDYEIEDIARSLSNIVRWGGHLDGGNGFSVGEHSIHVLEELVRQWPEAPVKLRKLALLHDATEGTLTDVISPLKRLMPDYRAMERLHEDAVAVRFGLPAMHPLIHEIDKRMAATEKLAFFPWARAERKAQDYAPLDIELPDPRFLVRVALDQRQARMIALQRLGRSGDAKAIDALASELAAGGEIRASYPSAVEAEFLQKWAELEALEALESACQESIGQESIGQESF